MTPDKTSTGLNSGSYLTSITTFTFSGIEWKMNQWNPSSLQIKTNQSSAANEFRFYNNSAFPGRITKVVIKFSALTLSNTSSTGMKFVGGTSAVTSTTGGTDGVWNSNDKTLTWSPNASDNFTYFAFYQNGRVATGTNNLVSSDAIVVTYETSTGGSTPVAPAAPTFSPTAGEVEKGTQITFSSETTGCTFRYTTDGTDPTATTGTIDSKYTVNSDVTLKVVAVKDGLASETVSSASYTVAKHKATFYINGTSNTTSYAKGDAITVPSNIADIEGKKFQGWVSSPISGTTDTKPTFVTPATTMGTEDVTYYAVFATVSGSGTASYKNVTSFTAGKVYLFGAVKAEKSATLKANTDIAAINFTSTSSWGSYVTLTPNTSGIIETSAVKNENLKWTLISITDGAYVFKSGANYLSLGTSTGSSTAGVSSTSASVYLENANSVCKDAFLMHPTSSSSNKLLCNTSSNYGYRMYGDTQGANASMCPYIRFYEYDPGTTYSDYVTSCKTVKSISVKTAPTTNYKVGGTLDLSNLVLTATYSDETTTDITTGYTASPVNGSTLNENTTVTITYQGQMTSFDVTVQPLDHIEVTTEPSKKDYVEGDLFDNTDMVVMAFYGTGDNEIREKISDYTIEPSTGLIAGATSVTIKYGGKETTVTGLTVTEYPKYTVTFNAGANGTCDTSSLTEEVAKGGVTLPNVTSNDHYEFVGWATTEGATTADAGKAGDNYKPTEATPLYAVYRHYFNVTWSVVMNTDLKTKVYDGEKVQFPATPGKQNEKVFMGWCSTYNYKGDTAPTYITNNTITPTEDVAYYAVFATKEGTEPTAYTRVTQLNDLDGKDKIVVISNKSASQYLKTDLTASNAPAESNGCIAIPSADCIWNLSGDGTNGYTLSNSTGPLGTATLQTSGSGTLAITNSNSVWTIGNMGNSYSGTHYLSNKNNVNLTYNSGWNTYYSTSVTTSQYAAMKLYVPNSTARYSGFTTFYAAGETYDVTYNKNTTDDVIGDLPSTQKYSEGETVTISNATLSRAGYNFVGWNTDAEANEGIESFEMPGEATVVYAIWSEIEKYTVTFNVKGTTTPVTETIGAGGVNPVATPAIGDYTFVGWSETEVIEETTTKPVFVTLTNGKYYPTADNSKVLYAVYAKDKNLKKYGLIISHTLENSSVKYLGSPQFDKSGGEYKGYFSTTDNKDDATPIYIEGNKLCFYSGTTKYYVNGSSTSDLYRVDSESAAKDWTITTGDDDKMTFYGGARYLAYNNRFASYIDNSTTTYPKAFSVETSTTYVEIATPHYTTIPSSAVTPTSSFANASVTIDVVEDVEGERQFKSYTQAVTTNSKGTKTYSLCGEGASDIATIDASTGTVTAKKAGTVTVNVDIAAVDGEFYADNMSYTLTFQKVTPTVKFDLDQASKQVLKENRFSFTMTTNSDATPYITSTNTDVTIDGNIVTVKRNPSRNSCTIKANVDATDLYTKATGTQSITVNFGDNSKTQTIAFPEGSDKNFVKGDVVDNFTIAATDANTTVTYASNNTDVAEVDETTGEVTVHTTAGGTAVITATAAGDLVEIDGIKYRYNVSTATYTINVDNMARPVISVAGGNYDAAQTVTLTAEDAFAVVYTLDGSNPSYNIETKEYNGEMQDSGFKLTINQNCTLKVIAINNDFDAVSAMAQATYTFNFPAAATTAWENEGDIHYTGENYVLTAPEGATISYQINEEEKVVTEEQVVNLNFENYGKYNLTVDVVKNDLTTTTTVENLAVYGFANIPFAYDGGNTDIPYCFVGDKLGSDYDKSPKFKFSQDGTSSLTLMVNDGAAQLSFDYKFNGTWADGNSFKVEMSIDGTEWETLKTYNTQLTSGELQSDVFAIPSLEMVGYHYFRWTYTKVSGNWALGNIKVLPAGPSVTIAGEPVHEEAYIGTQVVEVSAADAVIFNYTTDGTEPTTSSESVWAVDYKALINVTESCTLKVVSANNNDEVGAVTTAVITIDQPTEATDQNLIFERHAVHFTADETNLITNYHGQPVLGANTAVTYSVVNEGNIVATVDAVTGNVNITSATGNGTATITATAAASGNWNEATASYTITVGNLPAPTLQIAGEDFDTDKYYCKEQFAQLINQGGYIAYTITYNNQTPESALNGDIPGTKSDNVWLPSKYCEATGTYIDGVFGYENPNDIDINKITIRAVAAMPYIREEGGVKHEEWRAVSDEVSFVINLYNGTITLDEANTTIDEVNAGYENITVTRTLKANIWNTFCVPFDMTADEIKSQLGANAEVKELDTEHLEVNGSTYNMRFVTANVIESGKPYMVRVPEGVSTINVTNKVVDTTVSDPSATATNGTYSLKFHGNYTKQDAPQGSYIISGNKFYNVNSTVVLKGFRGYITLDDITDPANARSLTFTFDDTTGIDSIDRAEDGDVYNLQGVKLNRLQRGINIVNGKKVIKY